ncbi:hypothetical protein ACOSP7_014610 [Xanthoceras sorbifolium]
MLERYFLPSFFDIMFVNLLKQVWKIRKTEETLPKFFKRKGRGPNQINFNKIAKAKEVGVTFNELEQPLGDSSIALSTCTGTITTQMIPITYSSWLEVPDVVKDSVWETMKARFGLDDVGKTNVFSSMNTCWRQYKSRLTKWIRELSFGPEAGRMIQLLKPTNITDEDWSQFVSNRLSSEFDIISSKYSDLAKKNKAPHTTSRKGLARLREDLRAKKSVESGDLEDTEVDRVETWIAGHKHKDGTPVTEDVGEIIKQLEEISGNQATSISDDAVSQVLGKEHRGRVRGFGGGVTPTRVNTFVVGKQTTTQLLENSNDYGQSPYSIFPSSYTILHYSSPNSTSKCHHIYSPNLQRLGMKSSRQLCLNRDLLIRRLTALHISSSK